MKLSESTSIQNQNGELVFAGTDTAISILFNYLKAGKNTAIFLDDYPQVTLEQVLDLIEEAENQLKAAF